MELRGGLNLRLPEPETGPSPHQHPSRLHIPLQKPRATIPMEKSVPQSWSRGEERMSRPCHGCPVDSCWKVATHVTGACFAQNLALFFLPRAWDARCPVEGGKRRMRLSSLQASPVWFL